MLALTLQLRRKDTHWQGMARRRYMMNISCTMKQLFIQNLSLKLLLPQHRPIKGLALLVYEARFQLFYSSMHLVATLWLWKKFLSFGNRMLMTSLYTFRYHAVLYKIKDFFANYCFSGGRWGIDCTDLGRIAVYLNVEWYLWNPRSIVN